jgi:hypothetical protein
MTAMNIIVLAGATVLLVALAVGFAAFKDKKNSEACARIGMIYSARPYSPACVKSDGSLWEVPR